MKKLYFLLLLTLGFGWGARRAEGQAVGQVLTFSIICQYVTNIYSTNATGERIQDKVVQSVLVDSPNIAKALALQLFPTNSQKYTPRSIWYESNMITGAQGIFLRGPWGQADVTSYFTATNVFACGSFTNTPNDLFIDSATNAFVGTDFAGTNIPVIGGFNYYATDTTAAPTNSIDHSLYGLAYMTFISSNISFSLFGYTQSTLMPIQRTYNGTKYTVYPGKAVITGAGSFSLNVTTNFLFRTPGESVTNGNVISTVAANVTLATNYTGVAHGNIYVGTPTVLNVEVEP